jgi:SAM-dependent methyltransferase
VSIAVADTYVFDRSATDHARLTGMATRLTEVAREDCLRAGLRPGDRAVDVGCGPLGALPVLAELVGPEGTVVGLDVSAEALDQARRACDERGLTNVSLVQDDVNALDPSGLLASGPFHLAFCRLFLAHQADPAATLRAIAAMLRPGGRIVAQDFLDTPDQPYCDPPLPAAHRVRELVFAAITAKGGSPGVARRYPELCAAAGLRLVDQRGVFTLFDDPRELPAAIRTALDTSRRSFVELGLATAEELDGLERELADAESAPMRFAAGGHLVVLTAEVP